MEIGQSLRTGRSDGHGVVPLSGGGEVTGGSDGRLAILAFIERTREDIRRDAGTRLEGEFRHMHSGRGPGRGCALPCRRACVPLVPPRPFWRRC